MEKRRPTCPEGCNFRLEPQHRLCPRFDEESIAMYPIARPGEMGFRVVDNFAEEHMM